MVQNPQHDFRPNLKAKEPTPAQPYDPRQGPRTVTPFQTMTDKVNQGRMKDFRPIERDATIPEEVPEEVAVELRDFSAPQTGMNPVPSEGTPMPEGLEELTQNSDQSSASSAPTSPGSSEPPVQAPAPVLPPTPIPSSQD